MSGRLEGAEAAARRHDGVILLVDDSIVAGRVDDRDGILSVGEPMAGGKGGGRGSLDEAASGITDGAMACVYGRSGLLSQESR